MDSFLTTDAFIVCVESGTVLAYLGGLVDGDGYFKVTPNFRTPRIKHPYYAAVVGVAQRWPGEAVRLFAVTFGGQVKQVLTQRGTPMARCELGGGRAMFAARRLAPFLLVKRTQSMVFLEIPRVRPTQRGRTLPTETGHDRLETIRQALQSLQAGAWDSSSESLPVSHFMNGFENLASAQMGWTREETFAYLAGVMDSDGNFRIVKRRVPDMLCPHYRINIRCAQVMPSPAVSLLATVFGGRTAIKKATRPGYRNLASWSVYDKEAERATVALLPFLRVKWVEACFLLGLRQLKSRRKEGLTEWEHRTRWQRLTKMRKRAYSTDQVADFERFYVSVRALHAGPSPRVPSAP